MPTSPPQVHSVTDRDGAAILDVQRGLISTLNPTGGYVWEGLQRGDNVATIVAALVRETGEDPTVVEHDVAEFVQDLKQRGLFE